MHWRSMITCILFDVCMFFPKATGDPVLDTSPLNITAKRGFSVNLPCTVENLGYSEVMWQMYGMVISRDGNVYTYDERFTVTRAYDHDYSLSISNVKSTDEGEYICAVNTYPMKEKRVNLIVLVSPSIDDQMTSNDMVVSEGDDVTLRCQARGKPNPQVTWYRRVYSHDYEVIAKEKLAQTGSILNIPAITRHSAGHYICLASNGIEPSASTNISVEVLYAPTIQMSMERIGQYMGKSTILECTAEGSHTPTMHWYINGQRLTESWKYTITNYVEALDNVVTSALEIRQLEHNDYAVYTCQATNAHGSALHNITIFAIGMPMVVQEQSTASLIVQEGQDVDLECYGTGTPRPTMKWSKDDGQTEIGPGFLTLTNIQRTDSGIYTCTAANALGSDTLSIGIDVEFPPSVYIQETVYERAPGESVTASCTINGNPEPRMSWRREDLSEYNTNYVVTQLSDLKWEMTMTINSISAEDFGSYMCEAVNSASSYVLVDILELKTTTLSTAAPSPEPTTLGPTPEPTTARTPEPTTARTPEPTTARTPKPTTARTPEPTTARTPEPTTARTPEPTTMHTLEPTAAPTPEPTAAPTPEPPTQEPTAVPTPEPKTAPTPEPTMAPTPEPTTEPTPEHTVEPTPVPTKGPTPELTEGPTPEPTTHTTPKPVRTTTQTKDNIHNPAEEIKATTPSKIVSESPVSGKRNSSVRTIATLANILISIVIVLCIC